MGAAAAILLALLATPAPAQTPWPEDTWNPRPAAGDFVLPMPCGLSMVFRRVETPVGPGPLEDRAVVLGGTDPDTAYLEYLRRTFLVGPFGGQGQPAHYFIGKYEVMRGQVDALGATCPEASPATRLPAVNVSWFEAVDFSARWTSWLMQNARDRLPRRGDNVAFVRLPTEAEWEYAARGGTAVSEAEFQDRTFPMPEGPLRYAWVSGARSANGRLNRIGLLLPNPLGIHDILGNANEMMLEPFRLNRVGRDHGMAGGLIVRGGDFRLTTEATLRTSVRLEFTPFNAASGQPLRVDAMGFRVVLSALAQAGLRDTALLRQAFAAETRAREALPDDPLRVLDALRQNQPDPVVQAGLDRLRAAFVAERRGRADEVRQTLRAQLESAAVIARGVALADSRAGGLQGLVDRGSDLGASPQQIATYRTWLAGVRREVDDGLRAYARILTEIESQRDVSIAEQGGVLLQELRAQNLSRLEPLVELAVKHVTAVRLGRAVPRDTLLREILAVGGG